MIEYNCTKIIYLIGKNSRRDSAERLSNRPQLLAGSGGTVSVEPRVRRSSSQGSLVRGFSASLHGRDQQPTW